MPWAQNATDGTSVYFEDDGGSGVPVVLYGGILDSVESVRASELARALQDLTGEFRLVYADHRGLGRSDQHRTKEAYAMPLQAADFVAVLGALGVERAHLIGSPTVDVSDSESASTPPSTFSRWSSAVSSRTP